MFGMTETANILHNATEHSLVLMDEIGRGTSTFDGLSLAWATAHYIGEQLKAFTLFATHYFELTALADELEATCNVHLDATEHAGKLIFMHAVKEGPANQSYGLQVAALAGISKGNLTYHFPSKQTLFTEAHRQAAEFVRERIFERSFAEGHDTLTGLEALTRRLRRWMVNDEGRFVGCIFTNIAIETQQTDPEINALTRATLRHARRGLAAYLSAGQEKGEIRTDYDAVTLARGFFWMYEGALAVARAENDPSEYDAFRQAIRAWLAPPKP